MHPTLANVHSVLPVTEEHCLWVDGVYHILGGGFNGTIFSQNHNQLYYRKFLQVKFSRQTSCAVMTHMLTAQTAVGLTEEESGSSEFGSWSCG